MRNSVSFLNQLSKFNFLKSFALLLALTCNFSGNSQNIVAQYAFSGNANDASGNNYNGTVYGAMLTADRFGHENSVYYFDGIDDYIDLGDWENGNAMSFTFWARWDALNYNSRIIDLGNGSSSNNIIVANQNTTSNLYFSVYTIGQTKL